MDKESLVEYFKSFDVLANHPVGQPLVKVQNRFWLMIYTIVDWNKIYNMKFREDDVTIISHPKCGTHWFYYATYLLVTGNFGPVPPDDQRPMIEFPLTPSHFEDFEQRPSPRILSTHFPIPLLPKECLKGRCIYVYRNPKDVAVSMYFHLRKISWNYEMTFPDFVHRFMAGETFWGPYMEHLKSAAEEINKGTDRILFLSYEQMQKASFYFFFSPSQLRLIKKFDRTRLKF